MDEVRTKITITEPLTSMYDLLKRLMPDPNIDVEEARIEGREAILSLVKILEDQPFDLKLISTLVSSKAIILSHREDETMFGNALGFNWLYEKGETTDGESED